MTIPRRLLALAFLVGLPALLIRAGEGEGKPALEPSQGSPPEELSDKIRTILSGPAFRVSLDGKLDLTIDMKPAMERYGGRKFEKYLDYVDSLDFRIRGTTDDPSLRAPELKDLARGAINDLFRKYGDKDK